ncbi:MAG TPA: rhomboid family intramembrane serine protease [Acidimicrobiales bacterium]|nr:rhomboid family intramembrane serine protease [Acidimicrobiales bacterium]
MAEQPEQPLPRQPNDVPARAAGAAMVMAAFLGVLWAVQLVDSVSHYPLLRFGIVPRNVGKLEDVVTAPFIHASWTHLLDNSLPLLVTGFFVALAGLARFVSITAVIVAVSGLGVWLTAASGSRTVGASGVIFGYFGFLVARGIFDRRLTDLLVGLVVGALYWSVLPAALPGSPGISWQAHLFGLAGGVLAARLFRRPKEAASPPRYALGGSQAA